MSKHTFRIEQNVHWRHLDALNHVNNAEYFTYFENVRIMFLRELGYGSVSSHDNFGPILANISCQFKAPLEFPDQLSIGCGVTRIGNSSFDLGYDIFSETQDRIVAEGASVVVMVNYSTGKSVPIPEEVRKKVTESFPDV